MRESIETVSGEARVAPEKAVFRPALPRHLQPGLNGTTMKMTYKEQLLHPNWQKRRLERLAASGWECTCCGSKEKTLHVHHRRYIKGRMAWEYSDEELRVLCNECHSEEHEIGDSLDELLANIDLTEALALLRGYHVGADFDGFIGDIGRDRRPDVWSVGIVAMVLTGLRPDLLKKAAEYAVSLTREGDHHRELFARYASEFDGLN